MGLTLEEHEIHVHMSGRTETVNIYTTYPHWIKRLDKYCEENPDDWKCVGESKCDGEVVGKMYECPRDLFKLQKKKRQISEEQRRASAERLAAYRQAAIDTDEAEESE